MNTFKDTIKAHFEHHAGVYVYMLIIIGMGLVGGDDIPL